MNRDMPTKPSSYVPGLLRPLTQFADILGRVADSVSKWSSSQTVSEDPYKPAYQKIESFLSQLLVDCASEVTRA
ncbi:unnamed protein product [Protopolystoma xenopodis]|uniref:Uncharacterized protein n=1 Tax=Protopolystoma xenopodis TaxID=117903 RepID=A0A448XSS5_9PLAT|nr:unnamed protein product [Protopolystoma xenopodis]